MRTLRKAALASALCAVLLAGPSPAAARVTVTVEFAYGGVVIGGVGVFLYFAGSWEMPFAGRELPTSLLEISEDGARLGIPIPRLEPGPNAGGVPDRDAAIHIDLVRWRF